LQRLNAVLFSSLVLLLCVPRSLPAAQSQWMNGTIEGTVTSETGAPVAGATVLLKNRNNGSQRQIRTNPQGRYRALQLPLGVYDIEVQQPGFSTARQTGLVLSVAQRLDASFRLNPPAGREIANPVVVPAVLDTTRQFPAAAINRKLVENLPLVGRKFLDLGVLVPGGTESGDRDTSATAVFSGVNHFYTNMTIDGGTALQAWSNLPRGKFMVPYEFSPNAIEEFQVLTSDFPAEFGRSAGGLINIVTKSGTNQWHGDASYYLSDSAWNATPRFASSKPDTQQQQIGGSLGGPLVGNKLFLFSNYDQQTRNEPVIVTPGTVLDGFDTTLATITNQAERQRFIAAGDFVRSQLGDFDRDLDNRTFLARTDWQAAPNHSITTRYNFQDFDANNVPENGFNIPISSGMALSNLGRVGVKNHSLVTVWNAAMSPSVFNEARLQFAFGREDETANTNDPQVRIGNQRTGFTFGRRQNFPTLLRETRWELADNLTLSRGRHEFKTGMAIDRAADRGTSLPSRAGAYQFNNLRNFANGRYQQYVQAFGTAEDRVVSPIYGVFFQDNIKVGINFNVNIGVRYEFQDLMSPSVTNSQFPQTGQIRNDKNNLAPRFGFSWSPGASHRQVLRGSYGIHYAPLPLLVNSFARTQNGITQYTLTYRGAADNRGASPDAPEYPAILPPQPPGARSDITVFSRDFATPYVQHANLEIEREIISDLNASVAWHFTKGTRLRRNDDINLFPPVLQTVQVRDTQRNIFGPYAIYSFGGPAARPFAAFNQIDEFAFDNNSVYHALVLQARKPYGNGLQFLFNYTWSKLIDSEEAPGGQTLCCSTENPFARDERGLARRDQRHRANLAVVWDLPSLTNSSSVARHALGGWRFSGILKAGSGRPYTATITGDNSGDLNGDAVRGGDRAPFFGRNTFTGPGYASADTSLEKRLFVREQKSLGVSLEVFNVFNRANYLRLVTDYFNLRNQPDGSILLEGPLPSFGMPQDATRSREVQLALKFKF
jgi:hypothetical protein